MTSTSTRETRTFPVSTTEHVNVEFRRRGGLASCVTELGKHLDCLRVYLLSCKTSDKVPL